MKSIEFHRHGDPFLQAVKKHDKPLASQNDASSSSSSSPGESHCHGDPMLQAVLEHDKKSTNSMKKNSDGDQTRISETDEEFKALPFNDPLLEAALKHDRVTHRQAPSQSVRTT
eukprot:scaffold39483_cov260-Amphora_coffeaeformis.AAC.2